jgi:hypothetical protein
VTGFDVALDVYGITPDDYLWEQGTGNYRDPVVHRGRLETLYLGNRSAARGKGLVRIYDKGVELGDPGLTLTRIERECRSNTLRVRDLPDLPNVLRILHCLDVSAALADLGVHGIPPMYRNLLRDACAYRGSRVAISRIDSPQLRQRLAQAIGSSVPAFWDLPSIWSGWKAAVADVFCHEPAYPPEKL